MSSSGLVSEASEPRDNPLTPGDAVTRVWTGKDDFCIEYPLQTPSYRGDGSDLLAANPIDMLDHDGDQEE